MSSNATLVLDNFIWRMENITPSSETYYDKFQPYDPREFPNPGEGDGWTRKFFVEWADSNEDENATDATMREASHVFTVNVEYPYVVPFRDQMAMILDDRSDIIKSLRDMRNCVGYDDSHSTTDIGLMIRKRTGDQLDRESDPSVWRLIIQWDCFIRETEN